MKKDSSLQQKYAKTTFECSFCIFFYCHACKERPMEFCSCVFHTIRLGAILERMTDYVCIQYREEQRTNGQKNKKIDGTCINRYGAS